MLYLLVLALTLVASAKPLHSPKKKLSDRTLLQLGGSYDYVVVGAGTAGAVIASRLSEDPGTTVALVEAGGDYHISDPEFADLPGGDVLFCGWSPADTNLIDWQYNTVPQTGAAGRRMHYARGKCLGGSSARNFMIYQRGTSSSYDKWEELGNPGWGWDDVLPYFKKSPHITKPNNALRGADGRGTTYDAGAFSAKGGPLQLSFSNYAQEVAPYLRGALNQIGIPTTEGFSSGKLNGVQFPPLSIRPSDGTRSSSASAFLDASVMARPNLHVLQYTLATKINFNGTRATGVSIGGLDGIIQGVLSAKREVIISAGAFNSPQLLMLSGIGPRDQLKSFGIPVLHENPNVGQNMQDHIFFGPSYPTNRTTFTKLANDPLYLVSQLLAFHTTQTGPLTNNVADMIAFERFSDAKLKAIGAGKVAGYPKGWPTVEYLNAPGYVGDLFSLFAQQPKDLMDTQYTTILGALVAPQSRGTVKLVSNNAAVLPAIDPKWLTDPADQAVAIEMFKRMRQAFATASYKSVLTGPEYYPGAKVSTDAQILAYAQKNLMTVWHASCTCAMLPEKKGGVLDPKLKVYGTDNVRVVDASSFPMLPPGHPQSTVYMLAEKAVDIIRAASSK